MRAPSTFDIRGPLPTGTTVLEASAGTGKTHTIAALAVRYVAEGVARLDELMLVTFGRLATVELRERVRERLVATVLGLADPEAASSADDELLRHLADGTEQEVALRRRRLGAAVANFDAATIATTHGFCHQMLAGLGVAADVDPDVTFMESADDVVTEVVTDLYVRKFGLPASEAAPFSFKTAASVAASAVGDRAARLEPRDAEPGSAADLRRRLGEAARAEVDRRKRRGHILDYDDLLMHLRDALADRVTGAAACQRIRGRYRVVLVDEFQDTDPVQWDILRLAFHGHRTLVLIGDPKQAIYAFRGADVVTYLIAREEAGSESTLGTNWRSDRRLVGALGQVMGGVALGDPNIVVREVEATKEDDRLVGAHSDAALRVRVVGRNQLKPSGRSGLVSVKDARPHVAADLARDVVSLLESGARLVVEDRAICPGDIAVLVQRNEDGRTVREALHAAGVPVVLTGTSSVFLSEAADEWLTLLAALEQPHRPGLARAAALTSFVGWTADRLGSDDEDAFDELSGRLRTWAGTLATRGVAALLEVVTSSGLTERVLARSYGERHLTDLRHIGQALHVAATQGEFGLASLVSWLQRRMSEAGADVSEERSRRLESDAEAVQIITVHRSKGLEFPVVYAPYLWDRWVNDKPDPLRLHDDDGSRVLDVGGPDGGRWRDRRDRYAAEDSGESLRLAYVALTRARSQVVTWWVPSTNTACAPLHRFLFGDPTVDGELPDRVAVPGDSQALKRLRDLAAGSSDAISVEETQAFGAHRWRPRAEPAAELAVREFGRSLDLAWSRTSYSGLTAGLHDSPAAVGSEAEAPGTVDEPEPAGAPAAGPGSALPSPMAALPVGASFGTLVHSVLEELDFTSSDLGGALVERCDEVDSERVAGVPSDELAEALRPCLLTPLGPLADGMSLAQFAPSEVLAELEYEYPLAGGDSPGAGQATVGDIGELLAGRLASDDPLRRYSNDLRVPSLRDKPLRGFIGGFLDAVLRVRGEDGVPRYLVVDYKTNWLGTPDQLTSWHYRPEALARAMREAHYPLQALLYAVALHRYLRWRQPGYDPSIHLGGVLYLFLRGMCGPESPQVGGVPTGVFSWRPPAVLVEQLSDLLDAGGP